MLLGISPLISPQLLSILSRMGHGDQIVLADAHFPAESHNKRVIRADGIAISSLLKGIIPLITIDNHIQNPLVMMAPDGEDLNVSNLANQYYGIISKVWPETPPIIFVERNEFYKKSMQAFAIVITGETQKYGNLIIQKGVIPIFENRGSTL